MVAERFIQEHYVDPREDPSTRGKLWRECEDAKRTLSARSKAAVACDYRGFSSRIEITRDEFEHRTHDLLDRTRFTAEQTLRQAGMEWSDLDKVLLVGGSTRMPMVKQMLTETSGHEPDASVAADEAVAHGAALHAGLILSGQAGKPAGFSITNVNSHSLGVVGTDPQTKRRRNGIIIPRNTKLPCTARRIYKTQRAGQRSILVPIVEGESASADDCTEIGKCAVTEIPQGLPAGTEIQVLFRYEANGRLRIQVSIPGTESKTSSEIVRENSLPKEHLDGWRAHISGLPPGEYQ